MAEAQQPVPHEAPPVRVPGEPFAPIALRSSVNHFDAPTWFQEDFGLDAAGTSSPLLCPVCDAPAARFLHAAGGPEAGGHGGVLVSTPARMVDVSLTDATTTDQDPEPDAGRFPGVTFSLVCGAGHEWTLDFDYTPGQGVTLGVWLNDENTYAGLWPAVKERRDPAAATATLTLVPCPKKAGCGGIGYSVVFSDGVKNGRRVGWREKRPCSLCAGTGLIPAKQAAHIAERLAEGEGMREDRIARGVSLRDEALARGMTPMDLNRLEHGRPPSDSESIGRALLGETRRQQQARANGAEQQGREAFTSQHAWGEAATLAAKISKGEAPVKVRYIPGSRLFQVADDAGEVIHEWNLTQTKPGEIPPAYAQHIDEAMRFPWAIVVAGGDASSEDAND